MQINHKHKTLKLLIGALILFALSCVEPYDKLYTGDTVIFSIDGKLTNNPSLNYIKLIESIPRYGSNTQYKPVSNADVYLLTDQGERVDFSENSSGFYQPNNYTYEPQIGTSYTLYITTSDGQTFESNTQTLLKPIEMSNVRQSFNREAVKTPTDVSPGHYIYADLKDPANETNLYAWDWVLYEQQDWCITCYDKLYSVNSQACTKDAPESREYDYNCEGPCWEIIRPRQSNVMKDIFSDGQEIKAREVAEIPVYQSGGALIYVNQYSIDLETYNFLELTRNLGINTGSLADTPPATAIGNVKCTSDPSINVAGYFMVAGVTTRMHWLDRSDVPNDVPAIGLLGGRRPMPEISDATDRPPLAPCKNSDTRTNSKPIGWPF
ncbi:DUF4249 domain-containing protein [Marinilongibacter aquaticus]|uniref:DUF4249 domain-containing protein n=1 Tax=Marinilongibacter aquaticus TaxID=2975157 RepID=UPI0021BD5EB5|nr:DUF4249 domain-containing protein [Marinilongibacter aquaticus]UBM60496.1 DUF4249 domain-containing protein [Marinilongibacter aquaticus]